MQKLDQKGSAIDGLIVTIVVLVIIGAVFGGIDYIAHAVPDYSRAQRLANERNQTTINDIQIAQTAQLVKVQQQKAQIQVAQAQGIAQSQEIIANTLTPAYLQYEAIEAQKDETASPNHTIIYIPSGDNGIPLVSTVNPQN